MERARREGWEGCRGENQSTLAKRSTPPTTQPALSHPQKTHSHTTTPPHNTHSYLIPGGSGGAFERQGFTFDVGASMMFGLGPAGDPGSTNLITRALAAVGQSAATVPDPTQIHYHLPASAAHPDGLEVKVWREYGAFIEELTRAFPHEKAGIQKFYDECWRVFNALNALELKSLEEPAYLLGQFARKPGACLTLASFVATNAGDVARKHITDPELLRFIDMECYCWSTVGADLTPMINAGMVFCDR
jgi:prolycopene isomerase